MCNFVLLLEQHFASPCALYLTVQRAADIDKVLIYSVVSAVIGDKELDQVLS